MNKFISITLVFCLLVTMNLSANEKEEGSFDKEADYNEIQVCFEGQSKSTQEMYDKSEIVIVGKVVDQTVQTRIDMAFTMSTIEVNMVYKGSVEVSTLTVLQTGGSIGEITTPYIEGSVLEIGEEKLFYLRKADEASCQKYGEYYIIMGGTQGIADTSCIVNEKSVYNSSSIINSQMQSRYTDPRPGQKFYISQGIKVYIVDNAGYYNTMWGFDMWTRYVGKEYITFKEVGPSMVYDILCVVNDYGDTDWHGMTQWGFDGNTARIVNASIAINSYAYDGHLGSTWNTRTCGVIGHEVGHALGLLHPEDEDGLASEELNPNVAPR